MAALGWLDDQPCTLCHLDLEPRNIMVQVGQDDDSIQIIGILDWDSALFLPQFTGCRPPGWLWTPEEFHLDDDRDKIDPDEFDRMAVKTPLDPLLQECMAILEQGVGEQFLALPFPRYTRVARGLSHYSLCGLNT